jgi:hypothetical protein
VVGAVDRITTGLKWRYPEASGSPLRATQAVARPITFTVLLSSSLEVDAVLRQTNELKALGRSRRWGLAVDMSLVAEGVAERLKMRGLPPETAGDLDYQKKYPSHLYG